MRIFVCFSVALNGKVLDEQGFECPRDWGVQDGKMGIYPKMQMGNYRIKLKLNNSYQSQWEAMQKHKKYLF